MRNGVLASLLGSALLAPLAGAPDPAATPAREPCAGRPDAAAPCGDERAVATVGGRELTLRDLDPSATPSAERLDAEIAAARREALDEAVGDALLELDAKRARTTSDRLYVREVYRRVAAPTDAE